MNLIQIAIDDRQLVLPPDFSIRFTFNFPLPYLDNIPISSTYWFTIPVEGNEITFKHCNNIYVTEKLKSYNCTIIVCGLNFAGKLLVKNASNKEYKAFAVFNDFFETILDKEVSEVVEDIHVLGTNTATVIAAANTMCQNSWPNAKYAFPRIKNTQFYGDTNPQYTAYGNYMNGREYESFKANYIYNNLVCNVNVLVPMPYLFFILNNIFDKIGWELTGNVIDDEDFKKLIYFNNYHLENISDPNFVNLSMVDRFRFALTGYNQIIFDEELVDEKDSYNPSTGIFTCKETGTYYFAFSGEMEIAGNFSTEVTLTLYIYHGGTYTSIGTYAVPRSISTSYFDFSLAGNINLTLNEQYSFYYSLSENMFYTYIFPFSCQFSIVSNGLNRFAQSIDLKNHVPRMNTSEFLSNLVKKFCFAFFFDFINKKVEIEHWNNIIDNNNYIDLTGKVIKDSQDITIEDKSYSFITEWSADELIEGNFKDIIQFKSVSFVNTYAELPTAAIINQICLVKSTNKYYVTYLNTETNTLQWKASFDNFYDIKSTKKDAIEIKTILNTLFMEAGSMLYPKIIQMGSSSELGINDQGLKFLNYHGFYIYPYANNTNYLMDGSKTTGVPMQTHGLDGTYNRYCKKLYEYLKNADPVEMNLEITPADFVQIAKLFNAGNKERKLRIDARNYIPESVDITVSMSKIESCKVKLL